MSDGAPFTATDQGVRLAVRLTPRASRSAIDGVARDADGGALMAIRLTAPPVDGAANTALIAFLAKALHLRKADIAIKSGESSRVKILDLAGDSTVIAARLGALLAAFRP